MEEGATYAYEMCMLYGRTGRGWQALGGAREMGADGGIARGNAQLACLPAEKKWSAGGMESGSGR